MEIMDHLIHDIMYVQYQSAGFWCNIHIIIVIFSFHKIISSYCKSQITVQNYIPKQRSRP